ncbi:uncharacterized protein L3040_001253 [Drepanopeziza brunnea f. sp. 'multigermtubi']|uniref:uncharacterized protein n=1 Tax=Drepanopeziza brunnea f. sp. 'multigermtubi' TaxID=698441 RepID=UPI002389C397|nr:hypothetical protein L3040_001253 [Drepanopeziza brunnea f. sp. 'multigermtubi']
MPSLSVPTSSALSSTQLVPATHPAVFRILHRLSRPSMLNLVLDWLDERNQENCAPRLLSPEGLDGDLEIYPPASSVLALRETYTELQSKKGSKRDVVDRIIEGDWRDGISLYQLAMADMQYFYDHPASQKWTALKLVRLSPSGDSKPPSVPRFHPATFVKNLQREVLPDVKAHYNFDRHATLPILILRVFILESPYNTNRALHKQKLFDSSKTFYVAFPDSSPHIYVSLAPSSIPGTSSDNRSLRRLMLEGIPKAFSKPRDRYKLESTNLSARNLEALAENKAGGRGNASAGGWGIYAGIKKGDNPLDLRLPTPESEDDEGKDFEISGLKRKRVEDEDVVKRRKLLAKSRFGNSALLDDGKGIERLDIQMQDQFPRTRISIAEDEEGADASPAPRQRRGRRSTLNFSADDDDDEDQVQTEGWRPDVRVTFQGHHVFAGVRRLVEEGILDGEKMPGWMTGEEGVSLGVVRDGRIKGFKGSGV